MLSSAGEGRPNQSGILRQNPIQYTPTGARVSNTHPSHDGAEEDLQHRERRQHENLGQVLPGVSKRGGHVDEQQTGLEREYDELRQRADRGLVLRRRRHGSGNIRNSRKGKIYV